nr:hypothetical protein B0A51_01579 [Rachicladosporium sp. CCFEE 5018]
MASSDMVVYRFDGSKVALKYLKDGDLLLGPDGTQRIVSNVTRGRDRLYRVEVAHRDNVNVTSETVLWLLQHKSAANLYDGPSIEEHRARIEGLVGHFESLTSEPGDEDRPAQIAAVKPRTSFWHALRSAVAWQLDFPREPFGYLKLRNALNGTQGIRLVGMYYTHGRGVHKRNFAWGGLDRSGKKTTWYVSQEEALDAAVQSSRSEHNSRDRTLATLSARFAAADTSVAGTLKVDDCLPGIDFSWNKDGSNLHLRASSRVGRVDNYFRKYGFSTLPRTDKVPASISTGSAQDEDDMDDMPTALAEVTIRQAAQPVTVKASFLAGLSQSELSKYFFAHSKGFELPDQPIPANPYFLGLWLGDGDRRLAGIANNHEPEIREFLEWYAAELDLHLVYYGRIQYAIVANPLPHTRTGDSLPTVRPNPGRYRPGKRTNRASLLKARLAAGWSFQVNRKSGERYFWIPPQTFDNDITTEASVARERADNFELPIGADPEYYENTQSSPLHEDAAFKLLRSDPIIQERLDTPMNPLEGLELAQELEMLGYTTIDEDTQAESPHDNASDDDDDDVAFITEQSDPRRQIPGARTYGALDDAEMNILIDDMSGVADSSEDESTGRALPRKIKTLLQALRGLGVTTKDTGHVADRKHIPLSYLKNSREVRLALLAGMIDSDGNYDFMSNTITILQAELPHARLFWDTVQLAQSLGFSVNYSRRRRMLRSGVEVPDLRMEITGYLDEIPCLLIRKRAYKREKSPRVGFTVQKVALEDDRRVHTSFDVDGDHCYLRDDYLIMTTVKQSDDEVSQHSEQDSDQESVDLPGQLPAPPGSHVRQPGSSSPALDTMEVQFGSMGVEEIDDFGDVSERMELDGGLDEVDGELNAVSDGTELDTDHGFTGNVDEMGEDTGHASEIDSDGVEDAMGLEDTVDDDAGTEIADSQDAPDLSASEPASDQLGLDDLTSESSAAQEYRAQFPPWVDLNMQDRPPPTRTWDDWM